MEQRRVTQVVGVRVRVVDQQQLNGGSSIFDMMVVMVGA